MEDRARLKFLPIDTNFEKEDVEIKTAGTFSPTRKHEQSGPRVPKLASKTHLDSLNIEKLIGNPVQAELLISNEKS